MPTMYCIKGAGAFLSFLLTKLLLMRLYEQVLTSSLQVAVCVHALGGVSSREGPAANC